MVKGRMVKNIKSSFYKTVRTVSNFGIVKCNSGKAIYIFNSIQSILNEYDAWDSMAMIVADTIAVNTGKQNDVSAQK